MNPKHIIAICGRKRSGKDTVANFFISRGYTHMKIASKLKDITQCLFGFTDDQIETDSKDEVDPCWGISPRKAMQFLGTEVMQYKIQELLPSVNRKFWITGLIRDILSTSTPDTRIVISDLRFLHEYEELKKIKCPVHIIKVVRHGHFVKHPVSVHPSEMEYTMIHEDILIHNDSTIEDLQCKIKECTSIKVD